MSEINWKTKCWVTAIYLTKKNKVLLSWNKNMNTWIPVGGHIEPGENPVEALRREVKEETGCEFTLLGAQNDYGHAQILENAIIQIEKVPHHGEHINTLLFGEITAETTEETDEGEKLKWFSLEELEKEKPKMLTNVYEQAKKALELARKGKKLQEKFSLGVKAFIVEEEKVLIIKRRPNDKHVPGIWDLPGGRSKVGDDPIEGVKRETLEEVGLEIDVLMPIMTRHYTRDDGQVVTGMTFLCKTKGKNKEVKLSEEHTEYKWAELAEAKKTIYPYFQDAFDNYLLFDKKKLEELFQKK